MWLRPSPKDNFTKLQSKPKVSKSFSRPLIKLGSFIHSLNIWWKICFLDVIIFCKSLWMRKETTNVTLLGYQCLGDHTHWVGRVSYTFFFVSQSDASQSWASVSPFMQKGWIALSYKFVTLSSDAVWAADYMWPRGRTWWPSPTPTSNCCSMGDLTGGMDLAETKNKTNPHQDRKGRKAEHEYMSYSPTYCDITYHIMYLKSLGS